MTMASRSEVIMKTGLELLREPFPEHQISYLPKAGVNLAYVGHAALTNRLLDCDPNWSWEPLAYDQNGLPALDKHGGMWGRLTVCGVTRIGYGHAGKKEGGDAVKELVGDFLRNAAMRFGAALDLWHKGDLHVEEKPPVKASPSDVTNCISAFEKIGIDHDALCSLVGTPSNDWTTEDLSKARRIYSEKKK